MLRTLIIDRLMSDIEDGYLDPRDYDMTKEDFDTMSDAALLLMFEEAILDEQARGNM